MEPHPDGSARYAFSKLPATTSRLTAVRYWRSHWPVEQGYQQICNGSCWRPAISIVPTVEHLPTNDLTEQY